MSEGTQKLCEVQGASKVYRMGDITVNALSGVNVSVGTGEFTVFSGPSGSGKSTLLNLIGCLDRPSSGRVLLEGQDVASLSDAALGQVRARRIGFIFQSFNLIPVLTAYENVELALRLAGQLQHSEERVRQALADVGLSDYLNRRPSQLSGGQQQRVAIARALVKRPALVIADEPTANLDSKNGAAILDLMKEMNQRDGVTFLFSTHDPMVMSHARRIVSLRDGEVVGDGAGEGK
ncbi:MAG TPA: ABC transporter ATP-binding protein [Myxococcota bacterium]|nr:ABC transporter ATP-binding protein [Myxococcota bacterium]HND30652.1 ABC transporter ATP-binding protein [Myxococcota bacterium]